MKSKPRMWPRRTGRSSKTPRPSHRLFPTPGATETEVAQIDTRLGVIDAKLDAIAETLKRRP